MPVQGDAAAAEAPGRPKRGREDERAAGSAHDDPSKRLRRGQDRDPPPPQVRHPLSVHQVTRLVVCAAQPFTHLYSWPSCGWLVRAAVVRVVTASRGREAMSHGPDPNRVLLISQHEEEL